MTTSSVNYGAEYGWEVGVDFPEWGNTPVYVKTITGDYLLPGETPKMAYRRVARRAAEVLLMPELEEKLFEYIWKNYICLATPVLANFGTSRGLPISCFSTHPKDSVDDMLMKNHEMGLMSQSGGGTAVYMGDIRPAGSPIRGGGVSDGIVPFLTIYNASVRTISQGALRRGSCAAYLPIEHGDYFDFLKIREPKGDINRQCLFLHHGVSITDDFMRRVKNKEPKAIERWIALLKQRLTTNEPYLFFVDTANNKTTQAIKNSGIKISASNLCVEIMLPANHLHSFVCCISSLNVALFDEWKDTDAPQVLIYLLEAVMSDFITKAGNIFGFGNSVRFAKKARALGAGILGLHTYYQKVGVPHGSLQAKFKAKRMMSLIREKTEIASRDLAQKFGEPEWCKGTGMRHATLLAIAPTVSNSKLSGNVSPGIEPWASNLFTDQSAKGTFIRRNKQLESLLECIGHNTPEVWQSISDNKGSVQHLDFLDEWAFCDGVLIHKDDTNYPKWKFENGYKVKDVYRTFREHNHLGLIDVVATLQEDVDQGISFNFAFNKDVTPEWLHTVHMYAWEKGLKSLYYCRTESKLESSATHTPSDVYSVDCIACDG